MIGNTNAFIGNFAKSVDTVAKMDALLVNATPSDVGKIHTYVGQSAVSDFGNSYEQNAIYLLELSTSASRVFYKAVGVTSNYGHAKLNNLPPIATADKATSANIDTGKLAYSDCGALITGTGGYKKASGEFTPTQATQAITVSGLAFRPKNFFILIKGHFESNSDGAPYLGALYYDDVANTQFWLKGQSHSTEISSKFGVYPITSITVNDDGFTIATLAEIDSTTDKAKSVWSTLLSYIYVCNG